MEIGCIKWAGGYNGNRGVNNNFGFITRYINQEEIYFHKNSVRPGSKLMDIFDESYLQRYNNAIVVYDIEKHPKKLGKIHAVDVQLFSEIKRDELIQKLSKEASENKKICQLLLDEQADIFLGNNPSRYFPLMHQKNVYEAFVRQSQSGHFTTCIIDALDAYFQESRQVFWQASYWKLLELDKEPLPKIRRLCRSAILRQVEVIDLLKNNKAIWRDDAAFFRFLPSATVRQLWKNNNVTEEDFCYILKNSKDKTIQLQIYESVSDAWILKHSESIPYLSEGVKRHFFSHLQWDSTEKEYRTLLATMLQQLQSGYDDTILNHLVDSIESNWMTEDSPWWPLLPTTVKKRVLLNYRKAGFITNSNATFNPLLEEFLEEYYTGNNACCFSVQQKEAIQAVRGVNLLFAVPGSGKTTVLVARAGFMSHKLKIPACNHLIMTYNRGAANEMKNRYKQVFKDEKDIPEFKTIHSFCYGILDTKKKSLKRVNDSDKEKILCEILQQELGTKNTLDKENVPNDIITLIGYVKNQMLAEQDIQHLTYNDQSIKRPIANIYHKYQEYLKKEKMMDYDDMLYYAYRILCENPSILSYYRKKYPYISLDETQDSSRLQHEIVSLIVGKDNNLFMVGDDDQSIYAFRGAVPGEMLDFQKRYPNGRKLLMGTNYRSDSIIVQTAEAFIRRNTKRQNKCMRAFKKSSGSIRLVSVMTPAEQYWYIIETIQKKSVEYENIAILFRQSISAFPLILAFDNVGIPFECSKAKDAVNSVLRHQDVKKIIELLKYRVALNSMDQFRRTHMICYSSCWFSATELDEIKQIWIQNGRSIVAEAVRKFLAEHRMQNKLNRFNQKHQKLMEISTENPREAIATILKEDSYNILTDNKKKTMRTKMQLYALLGAAEIFEGTTKAFLDKLDKLENYVEKNKEAEYKPSSKIVLSTMHSAKGLEYDKVIIIDAFNEIIPGNTANDGDWYDPEEERRLFYVAITRAKHELDIVKVQVYHDSRQEYSIFIPELDKSYPGRLKLFEPYPFENKKRKRLMLTISLPHYIIREGKNAGIYTQKNVVDQLTANGQQESEKRNTYREAYIYAHKGKSGLLAPERPDAKDLPTELTNKLNELFHKSGLTKQQLNNYRFFHEETPTATNYHNSAIPYALYYLPVNYYKIWHPFIDWLIPADLFPVDGVINILELGAGPGTTTLSVFHFYQELAMKNPKSVFSINYYVIEREKAFIDVFDYLITIAKPKTNNLTFQIHEPIHKDVTSDALKKFVQTYGEMDLILESNMINPYEPISKSQLRTLIDDIHHALRNYGSFVLIETAGDEEHLATLAESTDTLRSRFRLQRKIASGSQDVQAIKAVKEYRSGYQEAHKFSYAWFKREDEELWRSTL